jgi:hypothetical protein
MVKADRMQFMHHTYYLAVIEAAVSTLLIATFAANGECGGISEPLCTRDIAGDPCITLLKGWLRLLHTINDRGPVRCVQHLLFSSSRHTTHTIGTSLFRRS